MAMKPLIVAARYKYLLLVPFLVIMPIAAGLMLIAPAPKYTSSARVWVNPPALLPSIPSSDPAYASPAQNRANDLNELLATDSFSIGVAQRAGLAVDTQEEQAKAVEKVRRGTSVFAEGRHLVDVLHTDTTPAAAQRMAEALVGSFTDEVQAQTQREIEQAVSFYSKLRQDNQLKLDDAQLAQQSYRPASPTDAHLTELTAAVTTAQLSVNASGKSLSDAQQLAASPGTQTVTTRDAPDLPTAPEARKKKSLLIFPIVGLFLAVSLSAGLYALLLRTDNNIRVAEDLQALPGLLLLGTVPDVAKMRKRGWPRHFYRLALTTLGSNIQRVP